MTAKPADLPKRAVEIQLIKHTSGGTGPQLTRQKAACAAWCPFALFRDEKGDFWRICTLKDQNRGWGSVRISEKTEKSTSGRKKPGVPMESPDWANFAAEK